MKTFNSRKRKEDVNIKELARVYDMLTENDLHLTMGGESDAVADDYLLCESDVVVAN